MGAPPTDRVAAYIDPAVASELAELQATGSGGRAQAVYRHGIRIFELAKASGGRLTEEEAGRALSDAALATGLGAKETAGHLRRALRDAKPDRRLLELVREEEERERSTGRSPKRRPRATAAARAPSPAPEPRRILPEPGKHITTGHVFVEGLEAPAGYVRAARVWQRKPGKGGREPESLRVAEEGDGPIRPHPADVTAAWVAALPIGEPMMLGGKPRPGIDWAEVARLDLARVWPEGGDHGLPAGFEYRRRKGYRVALPLVNVKGELTSLKLRTVEKREQARGPWVPWLQHAEDFKPGAIKRLVFACPVARAMLRGEGRPEQVVITEGGPAWLAWASHRSREGVAVFGVFGGAWSAGIAQALPPSACVTIDTDDDGAGLTYAKKIETTIREHQPRARLIRSKRLAQEAKGHPNG